MRCINLDWLEVHCLEPGFNDPRDAAYFERKGWVVREREYGTRVYDEMFVLLEPGTSEPMIEVRRKPAGNKSDGLRVLEPLSCHLRLTNRACYYQSAASVMFEFITLYGYEFRRISRIDIALDFELFDSHDKPEKFIERYLHGAYRKCNVTSIRMHGEDVWEGQKWNSLSWGAKKSAVSTKLYCKSVELRQVKDKPYIRQAWQAAGLVDDYFTMLKTGKDGKQYSPAIWRLEFSLTSSVRGWVKIEDEGTKQGVRSLPNNLDNYFSKQQLIDVFASLCSHYFKFKLSQYLNTENGWKLQRKDRSPDKVLFRFTDAETFYKIESASVLSSSSMPAQLDSLVRRLEEYKLKKPMPDIIASCDHIIQSIKADNLFYSAVRPWNRKELTILRLLLSNRLSGQQTSISDDLSFIRSLLEEKDKPFAEK